jgi:hypothetical protein
MRTALGLVASVGLFEACSGWLSFIAEYQKRYDPVPTTGGLRSLGIGVAVFLFACVWLAVMRQETGKPSSVGEVQTLKTNADA